ncbi:MAG: protein kinase [Blastocatellia bacterium]|nr:protein kinase [Blastocatellia bacterium]
MNKELSANTTLSHYRIVSKIGAGGMGEVYLAQDTSELGRTVALKIVPAEVAQNKDRLQRFTQEARTVSNLNHPNILTVYEFGQTDSGSFIATEYIDGVTLREYFSGRRLKLVDVLDLAIQIVAALNAAHEAGITHRDLKPENVMVRKDHIVKVLDFGLAKLAPNSADNAIDSEAGTKVLVQTEPGLVMGTASYMSPEQSAGKLVDQRTDIWSLGVVLYEMLAGRVPFQGKDIHRQIIAIQEADPPPLSQTVAGVPDRLEEIVAKCLAKDKEERYQSAKDLLIDLRNLRRKLDVDAEIERTVAPGFRKTSGESYQASTQGSRPDPGTASGMQSSTSSAEYVVSEIKRHKVAAAIALLVLIGGIALGAYYLHARNSEVGIESIAVMPFVNESGNADVEYLSDGMTETLIKSLSNLSSLDVKPRSAVFRYKGKDTDLQTIAKELNVQAILNGRVAQRGDQLTLSLELVDVQKNSVIWSEQYQRRQSDLVSLQSEIARDVSTNLKAKLSGAEETKVSRTATADPEAYQAYLKGRYYWNRRTAENLKKAIEQFKSATDRDPNYALAFVGLGDCYAVLNEYAGTPTSETLPLSKAYAERALAIDGQLAEPHATLGTVNEYSWQWAESEKEFKRAIELNPNYPTAYHWYSILLKNLGRNDEAAAMIKRAQELDPLSSLIAVNVSRMYHLQNNYDASIENSLKIIELDPNFAPAYEYLALSYLKLGRNAEAIAAAEKAVDLSKRAGIALGDLGYVYAAVGKRAEAIDKIKELEEKYTRKEAIGQYIAAVYVGLGDKDKGFEWLEKDFQARNGKLAEIQWQMQFEPLRDDPRFKDLIRRLGLPE